MLIRIQTSPGESVVFNSEDILRIEPMKQIGGFLPDYLIYLASTRRAIKIDAAQFTDLMQVLEVVNIPKS